MFLDDMNDDAASDVAPATEGMHVMDPSEETSSDETSMTPDGASEESAELAQE